MNRPQIVIRDLFWLVLVVAMGLGWWLDHRRSGEEYENLQLQWFMSIPPPYPKQELLEAENNALRSALDKLHEEREQQASEQGLNRPMTDEEGHSLRPAVLRKGRGTQ